MNNKTYKVPAITGWLLLAVFVCLGVVRGAWTSAPGNPTTDNITQAPLNVSSSSQTKSGALTVNNALTVAGNATFTPTANSATQFSITNASGTSLFAVNSVATTTSISNGTNSLTLNSTGASLVGAGNTVGLSSSGIAVGALTVGATTMNYGATTAYKLGVGVVPTAENFEVNGTMKSSGYSKSSTGFCIGLSCITAWPDAGSGGVPSTGIITSDIYANPVIINAGYTMSPTGDSIVTSQYQMLYIYKKD